MGMFGGRGGGGGVTIVPLQNIVQYKITSYLIFQSKTSTCLSIFGIENSLREYTKNTRIIFIKFVKYPMTIHIVTCPLEIPYYLKWFIFV